MNLFQLLSEQPHEPSSSVLLEGFKYQHLYNVRAEILTSKRFANWRKSIKKELNKIQNENNS